MQPGASAPPAFAPPPGTGHEALQALLAFSALHDQVRRQTLAETSPTESGQIEKFVLDEVLQLVADRAVTLTGANGVAIALAEGDEIICRASSGTIAPDKQAKLNPNSGFSGACFRTGQIVRCDDTENDPRVNVQAARRLGTRSIVAVPLSGKDGTIGLLEAFSSKPFAFQDSNIRSLNLLAELILAAMKPEAKQAPETVLQAPQLLVEQPVEVHPAEPATLETPVPEIEVKAGNEAAAPEVVEPVAVPNFQAEEIRESAYPGLKIVVALVLLAVLVGTGVWWKLHTRPVNTSTASVPQVQTSQPAHAATETASAQNLPADKTDEPTAVTDIRHWSSTNSSTVVIDLQDGVRYEEHRLYDPDRIYFDLPDTTLEHKLVGKIVEIGDSFLLRVRVAQPTPGTTRVVLDTKNNPGYTIRMDQAPYRLVIEVHSANTPAPAKTSVDLFAPIKPPAPVANAKSMLVVPNTTRPATPVQADQKPAPINTGIPKFRLALDAGHGGWDEGTIGRKGLMEKDLALDIVARLGKLVTERLGGEVIYTRRDDSYIPLEKRAEIANLAQADFFVSIHANYSDLPSARGIETYYSNTYSSLNARVPGTDQTVQPVNWTNVDIREKALQSQRLAGSVQSALYDRIAKENTGISDRGVKKASYVVLTGTTMPAILAEVSFISSAADEKSLKRSAYRQRIAEALYKGIARFLSTQHKLTLASAAKSGR